MDAAVRLDKLLVERGLASSRARAEALIVEHGVRVNGLKVETKPSKPVPADARLEPLGEELAYVGRGALKLMAMVEAWPALRNALDGAHVLDVGASTGGFTEVALQCGAKAVCAVDAGRYQLHPKLQTHPSVWSVEQRKIQDFSSSELMDKWGVLASVFVVDVSFTGLAHVLPAVADLAAPGACGCILIKPQFEVGPSGLSRAGIVRNEKLRQQAIRRALDTIATAGFSVEMESVSPVAGGDGNIEHLAGVVRHRPGSKTDPNCTP